MSEYTVVERQGEYAAKWTALWEALLLTATTNQAVDVGLDRLDYEKGRRAVMHRARMHGAYRVRGRFTGGRYLLWLVDAPGRAVPK